MALRFDRFGNPVLVERRVHILPPGLIVGNGHIPAVVHVTRMANSEPSAPLFPLVFGQRHQLPQSTHSHSQGLEDVWAACAGA